MAGEGPPLQEPGAESQGEEAEGSFRKSGGVAGLGLILGAAGVALLLVLLPALSHAKSPGSTGAADSIALIGDSDLLVPEAVAVPRMQLERSLSGLGDEVAGAFRAVAAPSPLVGGGHASAGPAAPAAGTCEARNVTCRTAACKQLPRGRPRSIPLVKLGFPMHMTTRVPRPIRFGDIFVDATNAGSFRSVSARLLPSSPRALMGRHSFQSCAVVGNSGNLLLASYGKEIDAHDVVFRVNQGPTRGYERHTGTKTHFRLLNALWTAEYAFGRSLPLEKRVVLIASRGAQLKRNFEKLTRVMKGKRPDVQTTLLQHSALSRTRALLGAFKRCAAAGGKKYVGGGVPTSGLVLIYNLKDVCRQLSVYGFGRDKVGGKLPKYQYYIGADSRKVGNPTHAFAAELDLIHALAAGDHVRVCDGGSCVGTGKNKA